jgi:hypothetical protein
MIRELMVWWEINQTHTMGRYVYVPFDTTMIYEHLLGLAVLVFFVGWQLRRSRFGLALMVIGEDETVARQVGINVPFSKVTIFIVSAMFMTLTGALMAPRFGFINPNFAFNPLVSFQVVIMAILGGLQRLWGPVLGVIPLLVLSEELQTEFPFWYSVLLGLVFMVIVYFLPRGLTGLIEEGWAALGKPLDLPRGLTGPLLDAWGWLSRPILLPRGLAGAIEDRWVKISAASARRSAEHGRAARGRKDYAFGGLVAVNDMPLTVAGRDTEADHPNGSGKTTLLNSSRNDPPGCRLHPHGRRGRDAPAQSPTRAQVHQPHLARARPPTCRRSAPSWPACCTGPASGCPLRMRVTRRPACSASSIC